MAAAAAAEEEEEEEEETMASAAEASTGSENDNGESSNERPRQMLASSASMQHAACITLINGCSKSPTSPTPTMECLPTHTSCLFDPLVRSICPSIVRNDSVEAGIVLHLLAPPLPEVSGLEAQSGTTIRSDLHMLVVDESENGKGCKCCCQRARAAARSVYVDGNTASSTGLTVSLTLEARGLVIVNLLRRN